jgi:HEAT repeat protein
MRRGLLLFVLVVLSQACKPADPKDPKTWEQQLSDSEPQKRVQALQQLRKLKDKDAAPLVARLLGDPLCKEDAALALEDLGGPAQVQQLVSAIDTTVGAGSDQAARVANRTNAKVAEALGNIGVPEASSALLRLARATDELVRLSAIEALGKVKAKEAVPELSHIVDDPTTQPLLLKKTLVALGLIGDPAGIPALTHGLVIEKQGVSFLPESSFSLVQIGAPAVEPLLKLAQDQDPVYLAWAKENDRAAAGTYAKAALVLGDLGDPRAIPVLVAKLKYTDPDPQAGTSRLLSDLVRELAASGLGKLRAKEAAGAIQAIISAKDESDVPEYAGEALVWIGDRAQAKELLKKAQTAGPRGRQVLAQAVALLGDASLQKELQALATRISVKGNCSKELAALGQPETDRPCEVMAKPLNDAAAVLELAKTCDAPACWMTKLADPAPLVKMRAAYELGRAGSADAVASLTKAASDEDVAVRAAALRALDWLASVPAAKVNLQTAAKQLAAQLVTDQGKTRFQVVDEDLRRVQFKLSRL